MAPCLLTFTLTTVRSRETRGVEFFSACRFIATMSTAQTVWTMSASWRMRTTSTSSGARRLLSLLLIALGPILRRSVVSFGWIRAVLFGPALMPRFRQRCATELMPEACPLVRVALRPWGHTLETTTVLLRSGCPLMSKRCALFLTPSWQRLRPMMMSQVMLCLAASWPHCVFAIARLDASPTSCAPSHRRLRRHPHAGLMLSLQPPHVPLCALPTLTQLRHFCFL